MALLRDALAPQQQRRPRDLERLGLAELDAATCAALQELQAFVNREGRRLRSVHTGELVAEANSDITGSALFSPAKALAASLQRLRQLSGIVRNSQELLVGIGRSRGHPRSPLGICVTSLPVSSSPSPGWGPSRRAVPQPLAGWGRWDAPLEWRLCTPWPPGRPQWPAAPSRLALVSGPRAVRLHPDLPLCLPIPYR